MNKLAKFLEWLRIAQEVAKFLETVIPTAGQGKAKGEIGRQILAILANTAVSDEELQGAAIDTAVSIMKAKEPTA
jgi:hypothetical protein